MYMRLAGLRIDVVTDVQFTNNVSEAPNDT